jgi:hypothetical protein
MSLPRPSRPTSAVGELFDAFLSPYLSIKPFTAFSYLAMLYNSICYNPSVAAAS